MTNEKTMVLAWDSQCKVSDAPSFKVHWFTRWSWVTLSPFSVLPPEKNPLKISSTIFYMLDDLPVTQPCELKVLTQSNGLALCFLHPLLNSTRKHWSLMPVPTTTHYFFQFLFNWLSVHIDRLRFHIPLDTKHVISLMLFPANLLACTEETKPPTKHKKTQKMYKNLV